MDNESNNCALLASFIQHFVFLSFILDIHKTLRIHVLICKTFTGSILLRFLYVEFIRKSYLQPEIKVNQTRLVLMNKKREKSTFYWGTLLFFVWVNQSQQMFDEVFTERSRNIQQFSVIRSCMPLFFFASVFFVA